MMDVKPVKRCRVPAYPTRLEVLADPDILANNVPHNWRQNATTAAALGVFLAANACTYADAGSKPPHPKAAVVAPIFEHGEGRGATGCIAIAPPVFLSEEEALQVITEELTGAGLDVVVTKAVWDKVEFSQRKEDFQKAVKDPKDRVSDIPGTRKPLSPDMTDDEHRVAFEYVSSGDYYPLGGPQSDLSANDWDFKDVASRVAKEVEKKGPGFYFGTFYDPMVTVDTEQIRGKQDAHTRWQEARTEGLDEARRLLRLQVRDFIDWLKGQGVI